MAGDVLIHPVNPRAGAQARAHTRSVPVTFVRAFGRFWHHGDLFSAAAISYYALFSLLPLSVLLLVGLQFIFPADRLVRNIGRLFGGLADTNIIISTIREAYTRERSLGLIGIIALIIAATGVFTALQVALDRIWECRGRIFHHRWGVGLLSMVISLLIFVGMLIAIFLVFRFIRFSPLGAWLGWPRTPRPGSGGGALAIAASLAQFAIFWTGYRFLSNAYVRWRDAWLGALIATAVWHVVGLGLNLYLARISDFGTFYHQAQAIMALLVWVYGLVCSFLFGAEFTVQWMAATPGAEAYEAPPETPGTAAAS
jgi:membrane protein